MIATHVTEQTVVSSKHGAHSPCLIVRSYSGRRSEKRTGSRLPSILSARMWTRDHPDKALTGCHAGPNRRFVFATCYPVCKDETIYDGSTICTGESVASIGEGVHIGRCCGKIRGGTCRCRAMCSTFWRVLIRNVTAIALAGGNLHDACNVSENDSKSLARRSHQDAQITHTGSRLLAVIKFDPQWIQAVILVIQFLNGPVWARSAGWLQVVAVLCKQDECSRCRRGGLGSTPEQHQSTSALLGFAAECAQFAETLSRRLRARQSLLQWQWKLQRDAAKSRRLLGRLLEPSLLDAWLSIWVHQQSRGCFRRM